MVENFKILAEGFASVHFERKFISIFRPNQRQLRKMQL